MVTIAICSLCKGPVQIPELWGGSVPPVPTCHNCGAKPASPWSSEMYMRPVNAKPCVNPPGWNGGVRCDVDRGPCACGAFH